MSKRIEGPCIIPGCPGSGIKRGVTAIECDDPVCGFTTTVEHWVTLEALTERGNLLQLSEALKKLKALGELCDEGDKLRTRYMWISDVRNVLTQVTIEGYTEDRLDELEKFIKRVDSSVGDHDNRLDQLEEKQ